MSIRTLFFYAVFCLLFIAQNSTQASEKELNEIKKKLNQVESLFKDGLLEEGAYNSSKKKLLERRKKILAKNKPKKESSGKKSTKLQKELEVIKKLYDDGLLTKEEYEQTREVLINKENKKIKKQKVNYTLKIKRTHGRVWEKASVTYDNYVLETYRPGGIKITRISDGTKIAQIVEDFDVRYFNGGENIVSVKMNKIKRKSGMETLNEVLDIDNEEFILKKLFKRPEKSKFDPDAHKLELFINDVKILHWEGRYNKKHNAFFYQVLTRNFEPFHFYIDLVGKAPFALNMNLFNKKIEKAVNKAKERIASEYNVTLEQIDKIIEERIGSEIDDKIEQSIEESVSESVAAAIEQTVGDVMAATLVNAIEEATGEAIEQSLEEELAAAIDAEIAYAVSIGIEEAAVTAGWQAYFDVLAQGGTPEQASAAAYKACGSACDNY